MELVTLAKRCLARFSRPHVPVISEIPAYRFVLGNAPVDYAKELGIPGFNEMLNVSPETFELLPHRSGGSTYDFPRYLLNLRSFYELIKRFMSSETNDSYYATLCKWGHGEDSTWNKNFRTSPMKFSFADQSILVLPGFSPEQDREAIGALGFGTLECIRGSFDYGFYGLYLMAIPRNTIGRYVENDKRGSFRFLTDFTLPPEDLIGCFGKPTPRDDDLLHHLYRAYWAKLLKMGFTVLKGEEWRGQSIDPWKDVIPHTMVSREGMKVSLRGAWGFCEIAETWHRLHAVCETIKKHQNKDHLLPHQTRTSLIVDN